MTNILVCLFLLFLKHITMVVTHSGLSMSPWIKLTLCSLTAHGFPDLKRFSEARRTSKLSTFVNFPMKELDLREFASGNSSEYQPYSSVSTLLNHTHPSGQTSGQTIVHLSTHMLPDHTETFHITCMQMTHKYLSLSSSLTSSICLWFQI